MHAGMLRERITLLRPRDAGNDTQGRRQITWETVATVHAKVADVSGRDFYQAAAYQMEDVVTFSIRHRADIAPAMEIAYGTARYKILQINHLGYKRDFLQIKARQITAKGV